MGHSEYDPGAKGRRPWNVGRKLGGKRALKPQQVWAIRFWLDRERRLRDRAMFDLAIDSKLRGATSLKSRSAISPAVAGFVHARSSFSRKQADPFSSSSSNRLAAVFWRGLNAAAARSTTSSFQAGSIMPIISALGSMLASLMSGSPGSDCAGRITGRIRFAEPRHRSSINRQVTCAQCRYCSATQRSKVPFGTSAST